MECLLTWDVNQYCNAGACFLPPSLLCTCPPDTPTYTDQLDLYKQARDIEARNRDEYLERAKGVTDPKV